MGLVQVDTYTIGTAASSITLGGGSGGSSGLNASIDSDDVYMVTLTDFQAVNDTVVRCFRVTKSGSADTSANYDSTFKGLYADAGFSQSATPNTTNVSWGWNGTQTHEKAYGVWYLYNFNNSSEYSFGTFHAQGINYAGNLRGYAGGFVHTVASASDGINFHVHDNSNITSGTFTLYKVT